MERTLVRRLLAAAFTAFVLFPGAATAGDFARCRPEPTVASRVADADLLVLARARAQTVAHLRTDGLATSFTVETVLVGADPGRRIRVHDCDHWKCPGVHFERGDRVLLFLRASGPKGHCGLASPGCRGGFTNAVISFDPGDPIVQEVFTRAGRALPGAPDAVPRSPREPPRDRRP